MSSSELNSLLDKTKIASIPSSPNKIIVEEWDELRKIMWSGNGIVTPRKFVHNVQQLSLIHI